MADTTHETKVKVTAETSGAERAFEHMTRSTEKLSHSVEGMGERLNHSMRHLALLGVGALGAGAGLHELIHTAMETNVELEQMKRRTTGAIFAFTQWKDSVSTIDAVSMSMAQATKVTAKFEEIEEKLAINAPDIERAFGMLSSTMTGKYGLAQEKVIELTENAGAAAKVFGRDIGEVSTLMTRVFETRVLPGRALSPIANMLRRVFPDPKELKKLSPEQVLERMTHGVGKLGDALSGMPVSFETAMFRLKDVVRDTVRDMAGPAFMFVGQKISELRDKMKQPLADGRTLAQVYGEKIKNALVSVVSVVKTLVSHWKEFAVVLVGMKFASLAQSAAGFATSMMSAASAWGQAGGAANMRGMLGGTGSVMAGSGAQMGLLASNLSLAVTGLVALYAAATALADWFDSKQDKALKAQAQAGANLAGVVPLIERVMTTKGPAEAAKAWEAMKASGLASEKGVNFPAAVMQFEKITQDERNFLSKMLMGGTLAGDPHEQAMNFASTMRNIMERFRVPQAGDWQGPVAPLTTKKTQVGPFTGPIYVNQKFDEADPDNVFIRFKEDLLSQATEKVMASGQEALAPG